MSRPAVPLGGPDQIKMEDEDQKRSDLRLSRSGPSSPTIIATIDKSRSSQLRVSISEWRGQCRAEIREATALIPTIFFPTSAGVTIDVRQLPALIKGLQSAYAEVRRRGWIK
jgi:hypothetical protein